METQVFYYLYKTINMINGKTYIGKHKTSNLNDGYIGSGTLLKRAIAKYGRENFICEVIEWFDTENSMNLAEKNVVTEEFCLREDNYNLCVGGSGGFSYINRSGLNWTQQKNEQISGFKNLTFEQRSSNSKKTISERIRNGWIPQPPPRHIPGEYRHSDDTRKKMSEKRKGSNNQEGMIWITNGEQSRKIRGEIPIGWYRGRTI